MWKICRKVIWTNSLQYPPEDNPISQVFERRYRICLWKRVDPSHKCLGDRDDIPVVTSWKGHYILVRSISKSTQCRLQLWKNKSIYSIVATRLFYSDLLYGGSVIFSGLSSCPGVEAKAAQCRSCRWSQILPNPDGTKSLEASSMWSTTAKLQVGLSEALVWPFQDSSDGSGSNENDLRMS